MAPDLLNDARQAIDQERLHRNRAVALTVLAVTPQTDTVFALTIASEEAPEPRAWTGAALVRLLEDGPTAEAPGFRGEVVEVHAETSTLYLSVPKGSDAPTAGPARLFPFDFLLAIKRLIDEGSFEGRRALLVQRMRAAKGELAPEPVTAPPGVLPALRHDWCAIWGPPGTGKTHTLVEQAVALLRDPSERLLLVSNTHRATDEIALRLGVRCRDVGLHRGVVRLGRVARVAEYREQGLDHLLPWGDPAVLGELEALQGSLARARSPSERALAQEALAMAREGIPSLSRRLTDERDRCVVTTAFGALQALVGEAAASLLEWPPFTTIFIDEASLVGRIQTAALSTLAARRVVLVGDPRQLSPITAAARTMPREALTWLARSGLDHLQQTAADPNVHRLRVQHRMHPEIRQVVSSYAYDDVLEDAARVKKPWELKGTLQREPRAIWYVLDEHTEGRARLASRRGPGGRSRERPLVLEVLGALFARHPELRSVEGMFLSPYRGQCALVEDWLRQQGVAGWRSSTVHAQQGAEADVVIFDTVHASSTSWPVAEWTRLVNVALSRGKQWVAVLASRDEAEQVWLRRLRTLLRPRVLRQHAQGWTWETVVAVPHAETGLFAQPPPTGEPVAAEPDPPPFAPEGAGLGAQLASLRRMRPLMSEEQARLVHRDLHDAGPRLVRGVAGSGKTLVLAHWVVRALRGLGVPELTVVHGNEALRPLLEHMIDEAWASVQPAIGPVPWDRIRLLHVGKLLEAVLLEGGLPGPGFDGEDRYDYGAQAARILAQGDVKPRFKALFIDEAQDLGHEVLRLLIQLTEVGTQGRKPVLVFYDNCQDLYRRGAPRWAELGLDLRGRSDVMRESFRSTRSNTELALEVLDRLQPLRHSPDLVELMQPGSGGAPPLLERVDGRWQARFCVLDGQRPVVKVLADRDKEVDLICRQVRKWVVEDQVRPGDIRVLAIGHVRMALFRALRHELSGSCEVLERRSEGFFGCDHAVVVTTPHSFKGYDAELVVVAGVDRLAQGGGIQHAALYVAMTRARTLMLLTATQAEPGTAAAQLIAAVEAAAQAVAARG